MYFILSFKGFRLHGDNCAALVLNRAIKKQGFLPLLYAE
jgi:hypothetical protein